MLRKFADLVQSDHSNRRVLQMRAPLVAWREPAGSPKRLSYVLFFNIKRNIF